jgi:transposase
LESGELPTSTRMAKSYSDDLRRRILEAYEQEEVSQRQLAQRFRVSLGYVEKIRGQQLRTGNKERIPHHPGRKAKLTEAIRERLRAFRPRRRNFAQPHLEQPVGFHRPADRGGHVWRQLALDLRRGRVARASCFFFSIPDDTRGCPILPPKRALWF